MNKWYLALDPATYPIEHWEEIKGARPVVIAGWEELDLCVNKFTELGKRGWWCVTEGRTGCVLHDGRTQAVALANTRRLLEEVGRERFEAKVAELVERFGPSPRYATERSEACSETPKTI